MTTFLFVRHAVTSHTGNRLSGWMPDIHLSDEGRDQARAIADELSGASLDVVYTSPIDRCFETAREIASRHKLRPRIRDGLGEVDYGRWTDRSLKTLAKTKLWRTVQQFPSAARFPDGETLRETQSRALEALELIRGEHPNDTVCCVSHADVIKLVTAHYLGVHIDLFQRIVISPASVTAIAVREQGPFVLAVNSRPGGFSGGAR